MQAAAQRRRAPERARIEKAPDGASQLVVDDSFDRAWRRVGLALDRVGFTVVDRDRSKGVYFVRYARSRGRRDEGTRACSRSCMFWKDKTEKPEQYRIIVAEADAAAASSPCRTRTARRTRPPNGEKILALLKDQLK